MLFRKTLVCLILFGVGSARPAHAAGCINGHPTVEQEFRSAHYVVTGKAIAIKRNVAIRLPYKNGFYDSRVMIQTATVHKQYKGTARHTITYKDEYSSAQFPMSIGNRYILFFRKRPNGELYIDVCGNSQELTKIQAPLLREIEKLASRR
jgi:hypothetical protein